VCPRLLVETEPLVTRVAVGVLNGVVGLLFIEFAGLVVTGAIRVKYGCSYPACRSAAGHHVTVVEWLLVIGQSAFRNHIDTASTGK